MSDYLIREIEANPRIKVAGHAEVIDAGGSGRLEWVRVRRNDIGEEITKEACGLFLLIGAHPCADWLPDAVAKDSAGYVLTGRDVPMENWVDGCPPAPLETTVPGIYSAGDIRSGSMKRVASASGKALLPCRWCMRTWPRSPSRARRTSRPRADPGLLIGGSSARPRALARRSYSRSMLFAFSVAPSTTDDPDGSVSEAVAEALRVVQSSGLPYELGSMFTTIEGEWDECMEVIKQATEAVGRYSPRVGLVVKADIRPGHTGQITAKVARVQERLAQSE
ncbi:thiamine-binding protein [Yimella sp. cx-51]